MSKKKKAQQRPRYDATSVSGLLQISHELTKMKAHQNSFGYYAPEDISQEIWISVQKSSSKFDTTHKDAVNPMKFFNMTSQNAIKNLKRDKKTIDNTNISDFEDRNIDNSFLNECAFKELIELVKSRLPQHLHLSFELMLNHGGEGVSPRTKTKIKKIIYDLLEQDK